MIRRILDTSLTVHPQGSSQEILPGRLPVEIEYSGPERPRKDIQRHCHILPFQIGEDASDVAMDVTLADSLPHTHAESLWVNEVTVKDQLGAARNWTVRDVASIPAAEFTREAAVVDLSNIDDRAITAAMLAERGSHIQHGDFVLLRTDYAKKFNSPLPVETLVKDPNYLARRPGLTMGAAEWLVRDRHVVGVANDVPGGFSEPSGTAMSVHTYFYTQAVLMIDEMINFDHLEAERVFFSGGLSLRTAGIGSTPARSISLSLEGPLRKGAVDMFHVMQSTETDHDISFVRKEPSEFRSEIYKRYDITWLQIAFEQERELRMADRGAVRPQRDFGSPIRTFSSHLGTHLMCTAFPRTEQLVGSAHLLDLSLAGPLHRISVSDLQASLGSRTIGPGEGVILRTHYSDKYYHRPDFASWSPGLEPAAIEWLSQQGVGLVAADFLALDAGFAATEARAARAKVDLPVVLGATRLWRVKKPEVETICSPVPLKGLDAYPCRLVLVETWT